MHSTPPAKKCLKAETGFVGFFDILGYKSFLEAGITDATFKVIEILDGLPSRVEAAHEAFVGPHHFETIKWNWLLIRFRLVSDSILLTSVYDENRDEWPTEAATFLETANMLQRLMFGEGLPVRGAIAFGDFILGENTFAGKPIVDAFELGSRLDLAACSIHKTAESEFQRLLSVDPRWHRILADDGLALVRYLTPVKKSSAEEELSCLNLTWPPIDGYIPLKTLPDVRQYVHEKFMAHGKQIGLDAIRKLENTERFLRFLQCHVSK